MKLSGWGLASDGVMTSVGEAARYPGSLNSLLARANWVLSLFQNLLKLLGILASTWKSGFFSLFKATSLSLVGNHDCSANHKNHSCFCIDKCSKVTLLSLFKRLRMRDLKQNHKNSLVFFA